MILIVLLYFICSVGSDHIIQLTMSCPPTLTGSPSLKIMTDITLMARAFCVNGHKAFHSRDTVKFDLFGTFGKAVTENECEFQEVKRGRRYSVNIEMGWGEAKIVTANDLRTATCEYNERGAVISRNGEITQWPHEESGKEVIKTGTMKPTTVTFIFLQKGGPIVELNHRCPASNEGEVILELTADVPAFAMALCRNGKKAFAASTYGVKHRLVGSFDQGYDGSLCQFYKKQDSNTYTVRVEVGWGDVNRILINRVNIFTVSCAYDDHGFAKTRSENIGDWFLAPVESQHLLGLYQPDTFHLEVVDVKGRSVSSDHVSLGRKIRLRATDVTDSYPGFQVLSCEARNTVANYPVLRAGCGDGLVFQKGSGFTTDGTVAYSPYFKAFKLHGGDKIQFHCNFTICTSACDGNSCAVVN